MNRETLKVLTFAVFMILVAWVYDSNTSKAYADSEQVLRDLSLKLAYSTDEHYLKSSLHADFVGINPFGEKLFKDEFIEKKASNEEIKRQSKIKVSYDEFQIRNLGSVAFVNFRRRVDGVINGQDSYQFGRSTYAFVRSGNDWKLVSAQITAVSK